MKSRSRSGVKVEVFRYDPGSGEAGGFRTYVVPTDEPMSLQNVIRYIYYNLDNTLTFRNYNCYLGVCANCSVKLDGKTVRSCATLIQPGSSIRVEPAGKRVIKDLVAAAGG